MLVGIYLRPFAPPRSLTMSRIVVRFDWCEAVATGTLSKVLKPPMDRPGSSRTIHDLWVANKPDSPFGVVIGDL